LSELVDIIGAKIEEFDALREVFFDETAKCYLIKRAGQTEKFAVVKELTAGWYIEWSEYRGMMRLSYATLESVFVNEIAQTSFVAFGIPDEATKLDVYAIDPERRDVVSPSGDEPFWKVYLTRDAKERFPIPV
jgi:hypothetical protein